MQKYTQNNNQKIILINSINRHNLKIGSLYTIEDQV